MPPEEKHPAIERDDAVGSDERSLAQLLKLSGERGMPTPRATAQAKAAAFEAWESSLQVQHSRDRRTTILAWAAAISLVVIGALAWLSHSEQVSSTLLDVQVATTWGDVSRVDASGHTLPLTANATDIANGTRLHTREGRVALTLGDSLSLRMNVNSEVRFDAQEQLTLLSGEIYVDSGGLSTGSDLRIVTPAGEVRHQGTQYLISVGPDATRILVREGRVQLNRSSDRTHVVAGERIDIDESGSIARRSESTFGESWEWVSTIVPAIDLDNRPLTEFLAWMSREHGWQLRYASPDDERAVHSIRLHGFAQGKSTRETLQRVSMITGLSMEVEAGVLIVGDRRE